MYWFSCPHGHEAQETKIGWFCKSCCKVYPKKSIVSLVAQTNKRLHTDAGDSVASKGNTNASAKSKSQTSTKRAQHG